MRRPRPFDILLAAPLLLTACYNKIVPPVVTLEEAHQKFLKVCKEEYGLDVRLFPLKDTLWIYLPLEKPLFEVKAGEEGAGQAAQAVEGPAILFLDGKFEDKRFVLDYDIARSKSYPKKLGYESKISDDFQRAQRNLLQAIPRIYTQVEQIPGEVDFTDQGRDMQRDRFIKAHLKTDKAPPFVVIVIADINKGIRFKALAHMKDLRQSLTNPYFLEEYNKRLIYFDTIGDQAIIGDVEGENLNPGPISLPEFLTEQILYRIKFKYQRSDFPPGDDTEEEILKIVNTVVHAYGFDDFNAVELNNLHTGETYLFDKDQLATYNAGS